MQVKSKKGKSQKKQWRKPSHRKASLVGLTGNTGDIVI
jgi:hypothetical protein